MMRVADYVVKFIKGAGVDDVFLVTGGGMMYLSDALIVHGKMNAVCTHHEQAAAMAAVSYARMRDGLGAAFVTTGCGGTNAITGLLDAWQDSTPCLFISGQVKKHQTVRDSGLKLRQFGVQEADIIAIVEPISKYAVMVEAPEKIAYHLEKALYLAKSGRPGPVWLDIPQDIQGAMVDEDSLEHFKPGKPEGYKEAPSGGEMEKLGKLLAGAKRPIIVAGQGIRLAHAVREFASFAEKNGIPFVTPILGINLLPSAHPLYVGRIGVKGTRAGNFAVQNSDLVIILGSRLSVSSVGYDYRNFAREAKKVVVDIDPVEHAKKGVSIDLFINADAKEFLHASRSLEPKDYSQWAEKCRTWKEKWPVCLPGYEDDSKGINLYYFVDTLSKCMKKDSVVVSDAGSAFYAVSQGISLAEGQRYITSGCQAEMGFTLPACVGASVARGRGEAIGITGDGSLQMNLQELQTVVHYKLPVKLFVWNNNGYLSIRATQRKFFKGRLVGTDKSSGVSFPDLGKIAAAYGIKYFRAEKSMTLAKTIGEALSHSGPAICEVMCDPDQEIVPTVSSYTKPDGTIVSRPMEDMYPFLDRKEFLENMIVKPVKE